MTGGRPAVFLDRDGVLNRPVVVDGHPHPPPSVAELVMLPGVRADCARLRAAGLLLVMVTNQPDVARGTVRRETVDAINDRLLAELGLDAVYVCPHDDADGCPCRKPAPGMLLAAATDLGIDLGRSAMVGDRWRDIEAGARAGVMTVWVRHDYDERAPVAPDHAVTALSDAVDLLIQLAPKDCLR